MKSFIKFIKKHKFLTIIAVIVIFAVAYSFIAPKDNTSAMTEVLVTRGNITTYNSFVGNVEASSDTKILSDASEKVTAVYVDKGDEVKKGDIIAALDTENIEYNISLREESLNLTKASNYYTVEDVKRNYDNFKEIIDEGLYTSLNAAERNLDSAEDAYDEAKKAYREASESIDKKHSYTVEGTDVIAPLYSDMQIKKEAYENEKSKLTDTDIAKLNACKDAYDDARKNYEDMRAQILDGFSDALSQAETLYDTARENYDYIILSIEQQLDTYEYSLEKTKALTSTKTSDMELEKLIDSLEDYTIKSPCDGIITSLAISEGDMVTQGYSIGTVSNLDSMQIKIKVDEYSVINTKEGSNVQIYIDSIDKTYDGTITWIADVATIAGGVSYYEADVSFIPDENVRSGMSVEVRLTKNDEKNVLMLPVDAISYSDQNTAYVNVKDENGNLNTKDIVLGVSDGTNVQIISGLLENDRVYYTPSLYDFSSMMMNGGQ